MVQEKKTNRAETVMRAGEKGHKNRWPELCQSKGTELGEETLAARPF